MLWRDPSNCGEGRRWKILQLGSWNGWCIKSNWTKQFFEMYTEYYQGRHPGWSSYPKGYPAPNWWSYRSWSRWDPPVATKTLEGWVGCGSLGTITDEICSKRHCPASLQWDLFLAGTFVCRWPGGIWGACPTCGISRCSVPVTASCGDRWDGRHFLDERLAIAIQMGAVRIGLRILSSRKGLWMGEVPTWSTWPHMKHMTHAISAANSLVPKMWHKFYEVIIGALKVFTAFDYRCFLLVHVDGVFEVFFNNIVDCI